jgi:uncharacterized protein (AIM24 family)
MTAHEIDYQIFGEEMQYVEIELDPQKLSLLIRKLMMDNKIQMETIFEMVQSKKSGIFGQLLNAGKRVLTGESLFMTAFINQDNVKEMSFAAPYPENSTIDLTEFQGKFICQLLSLLCSKGYLLELNSLKKIGRGFFGGEGFIMQIEETDWHLHSGGTLQKN